MFVVSVPSPLLLCVQSPGPSTGVAAEAPVLEPWSRTGLGRSWWNSSSAVFKIYVLNVTFVHLQKWGWQHPCCKSWRESDKKTNAG